MRYVLVPVPSEYVLDVMRWVLFRAPDEAEGTGRDEARVLKMFDELDEGKKALLLLVAKSVGEDDNLPIRDAAEALGEERRVVNEWVRDINRLWGKDIVVLRSEIAMKVLGQPGKAIYITMRPDIARLVRAAVRSATVSDE